MPCLPGVDPICEAYGLSFNELSKRAHVHVRNLYRLREENADFTGRTLAALKSALCCTAEDLTEVPTPARVLELKAAFLQREADRAQAEAERVAS